MPATVPDRVDCAKCGYANATESAVCSLCGELLVPAPVRTESAPAARLLAPVVVVEAEPRTGAAVGLPPICGLPRPLFHLLAGIPIALVLSFGPLRFAGWFLTALVHEMGHCAAALLAGCFAYPAIRLDGHAAAFHSPQSTFAALAVWAAIGVTAWTFRGRRRLLIGLVVAAAAYPLYAFTGVREVAHLAAGHLAELAFATVFFHRALFGGFVCGEAERPLYAALGWLLSAGSLLLFGSLIFSEASRQWYFQNGSFGLTNDFVVLARRFGASLALVSTPMLLLSLLPLPLAYYRRRRARFFDTPA